MGSTLSIFRSKDPFDIERVVDDLDSQLRLIVARRAAKQRLQQSIARSIVLYGTALFMVLIAVLYAALTRSLSSSTKVLSIACLCAYPLLIWVIKYLINQSISLSIKRDEQLIDRLTERRETIFKRFLDATDYEKLQRIVQKLSHSKPTSPTLQPTQQQHATPGKPNKAVNQAQNQSNNRLATPAKQSNNQSNSQSINQANKQTNSQPPNQSIPPQLQAGAPYATHSDLTRMSRIDVRPATQRTLIDKFVDFVLQDGPNARYALICQSCFTHNGLIRPEDYQKQTFNQSSNQSDKQAAKPTISQANNQPIRFRCCACQQINGPPLPPDFTPNINTGLIIQSTPSKPSAPPVTMSINAPGDVQSINDRLVELSQNRSANSSAQPSPAASPVERSRATSVSDEEKLQSEETVKHEANISLTQVPTVDVDSVDKHEQIDEQAVKEEKTAKPASKLKKRR